jgi:hypothetical protein
MRLGGPPSRMEGPPKSGFEATSQCCTTPHGSRCKLIWKAGRSAIDHDRAHPLHGAPAGIHFRPPASQPRWTPDRELHSMETPELLRAAHQSDWKQFGSATDEIDPHLYEVAEILDGRRAAAGLARAQTAASAVIRACRCSDNGHRRAQLRPSLGKLHLLMQDHA